MKERTERIVPLSFTRQSRQTVDQIERTAEQLAGEGWHFLDARTDIDFNHIVLTFEREIDA
jgi:hypothetical protein